MNEEDWIDGFKIFAKTVTSAFNKIVDAIEKLLKLLKLDDPKFRHNWTMARYSKKKRTRKKYAKKCIKLNKI